MKRMLSSPSTSPQVWWPMDQEPRGRDPKADRSRDVRRAAAAETGAEKAAAETGAERMDRSTVHRHDRRFSRDRLRNLRGSLAVDDDDTQWWTV